MKTKISVVSYKRPNNNTCNLLLNSNRDWEVYAYSFDPTIDEYISNYGKEHVRVITEFEKASLPKKRQLVLDDAIKNKFDYCIMMDDDIYQMKNLETDIELSIDEFIDILEKYIIERNDYVALSACYNKSDDDLEISDYKNICNNSIFNLRLYKDSDVKYNDSSRCEDMEFMIDLVLKGYKTGRLDYILGKNQLQGGTTNDGLSYRFADTNRFIEEGQYMSNRYPELKNIFEFDEKHFKINTDNLIAYLQNRKSVI